MIMEQASSPHRHRKEACLTLAPLSSFLVLLVMVVVVCVFCSGAVMGVPAHDSRDFDFATRNSLPVKTVIQPTTPPTPPPATGSSVESTLSGAFTEDGTLVNSGELNGLTSAEARTRILQTLEVSIRIAICFGGNVVLIDSDDFSLFPIYALNQPRGAVKAVESFRLRDWLVSRQRYTSLEMSLCCFFL